MLISQNLPASAGDVRDVRLILELERSPGGGNGKTLIILAWRIPSVGSSPRGCKESDMTEAT